MIAAWMLFAMEVSALLFVSAWFAERALLSTRRPVRGIWVIATVAANLLPVLLWKLSATSAVAARWALSVTPESALSRIGTPLLVLWGLAVAIGVFVCLSAVRRMSLTRPKWKNEHVDNTPVLVSHDIGPALVGVLHYSIVVPRWAYSLEERARRLLLTHEREHARHYDPLLLAVAALAVVVAPWNVFNWLFFRRLHLAVELDCDQRVLRLHPDARGYSELLLNVAERVLPSVMPAAALVEHGASLETRLMAMSEPRKSHQSLRMFSGVAASLLFAAAACFTPRPYIIIVNPPATASTSQATQAPAFTRPDVPQAPASQVQASPIVEQKLGTVSTPAGRTVVGNENEIRPVVPSARVKLLDAAEEARLRAIVLKSAPQTLGNWPRRDSALVLLLNDRGEIVKQGALSTASIVTKLDASYAFQEVFMAPEIGALRSASEITVDRGAQNEKLDVPLKVYSGQLLSGATVPLTRAEVVPSREAMLATLRANHPELLKDTTESSMVGALLFNSKGKLLKSAAVTMDVSATRADGSLNSDYNRLLMRKAFGTVMDSGSIVLSGTNNLLNGGPLRIGPTKMLYAVIVKMSETEAFYEQIKPMLASAPWSGSSSRSAARPLENQAVIDLRLRGLIQSRVPDAYGDWARGDSAVLFLFDADDQLIARKASKIPDNGQFLVLADLISKRVGVDTKEIETAGKSMFSASPGGRVLDKPLNVVWGRLSRAATTTWRN